MQPVLLCRPGGLCRLDAAVQEPVRRPPVREIPNPRPASPAISAAGMVSGRSDLDAFAKQWYGPGPQQLHQAAAAFLRIGVGHHHGVLGRIPVAQSYLAAYLDEGGKPGEHDVDFTLIQVPDVQFRVHALIGGGHLEASELFLPEGGGPGEVLVRLFLRILGPHLFAFLQTAFAQQIKEPDFFSGIQRNRLFQAASVAAALFEAAAAATIKIEADTILRSKKLRPSAANRSRKSQAGL